MTMKTELSDQLPLPDGVTATFDERTRLLRVHGPKGELTRTLYAPGVEITVAAQELLFTAKRATLREKKLLYTARAHTKNMLRGVSEGYVYRMKICSGHFPMAVAVKGDQFEIKNFIGEKVPRVLKLKPGTTVKVEGQDVTVTGVDKELVGQAAADIEKLSRRPGYDTRVFQDGIFIVDKAGKKME
jgi:large subunit ribosomal protein L6